MSEIKRFRVNPVEVAIFSLVALIFMNSVYNLLYDRQGFRPAALAPTASDPTTEGRSPASASKAALFSNFEVRCTGPNEQETTAGKVRLTGSLCGAASPSESGKLARTLIVNHANKFNATVFADISSGKFSTDYIPLNSGRNPIRVEFSYQDGRQVALDINVTKN